MMRLGLNLLIPERRAWYKYSWGEKIEVGARKQRNLLLDRNVKFMQWNIYYQAASTSFLCLEKGSLIPPSTTSDGGSNSRSKTASGLIVGNGTSAPSGKHLLIHFNRSASLHDTTALSTPLNQYFIEVPGTAPLT